MFGMRFTPVVALIALLTLRTSPGLAQARGGDGPGASGSTDGVSELDGDIAAGDSTRAVLAEDEARVQVDQARLAFARDGTRERPRRGFLAMRQPRGVPPRT